MQKRRRKRRRPQGAGHQQTEAAREAAGAIRKVKAREELKAQRLDAEAMKALRAARRAQQEDSGRKWLGRLIYREPCGRWHTRSSRVPSATVSTSSCCLTTTMKGGATGAYGAVSSKASDFLQRPCSATGTGERRTTGQACGHVLRLR